MEQATAAGQDVPAVYVADVRKLYGTRRSVIDEIGDGAEEVDLGGRSVPMRAYASWFNFKGADQQKSVGVLSGGERNRLQLAKVISATESALVLTWHRIRCFPGASETHMVTRAKPGRQDIS